MYVCMYVFMYVYTFMLAFIYRVNFICNSGPTFPQTMIVRLHGLVIQALLIDMGL